MRCHLGDFASTGRFARRPTVRDESAGAATGPQRVDPRGPRGPPPGRRDLRPRAPPWTRRGAVGPGGQAHGPRAGPHVLRLGCGTSRAARGPAKIPLPRSGSVGAPATVVTWRRASSHWMSGRHASNGAGSMRGSSARRPDTSAWRRRTHATPARTGPSTSGGRAGPRRSNSRSAGSTAASEPERRRSPGSSNA